MKTLIIGGLILISTLTAHATPIGFELGRVTFSGNFTTNHLFNVFDPNTPPFGTFGTLTATETTGIFAQHIATGSTLAMNTQSLWSSDANSNAFMVHPTIWQNGGYTFIVGGAFYGFEPPNGLLLVDGNLLLSGNGFNPNMGLGAGVFWSFEGPIISGFSLGDQDVTGPISLTIIAGYSTTAPETGNTLLLLCLSLTIIWAVLFFIRHNRARSEFLA